MTELGKGRALAITDNELAAIADSLAIHPAELEAIAEVESGGFGWFSDGRLKILFEKHWFYKLVSKSELELAVNARIARKTWIPPKKGGYKDQNTPSARYAMLKKAISYDEEAAFQSISMGSYQIMGFNYRICGFRSAKEMFEAFCDGEKSQIKALANFLNSKSLLPAIRDRDFALIEKAYNGGGLGGAYAKKMAEASARLRAGKWKNYKAGGTVHHEPPAAPIEPVPVRRTFWQWLRSIFQ